MNMEDKNKIIEEYIYNISDEINKNYPGLMDDDKISRAIDMFKNSSKDFETEIKPEIKKLAEKVIEDYLEFQKKIMEMMQKHQEEQVEELATLDLNTDKKGIYLSQQQIDLLMIVDLNSKKKLQEYFDNICGQFPYKKIDDVIPGFTAMHEEEIESAKKILFQKYQDGLIGYLENEQMGIAEKAKVKLEKLGINGEELSLCLSQVSQGNINEVFNYLGRKYGNDFITRFNRSMNDDFENLKAASYDQIKSLSNLIINDESLDSIIIATGKYNNMVYSTPNGKVFDSYLTDKAAKYCSENGKHLRYHATFDHSHIDSLIARICKQHNIDISNRSIDQLTPNEIEILKTHKNEVLAEQIAFTRMSLKHVVDLNKKYPGLITQYEVFNELVEKNKKDKNSPYEMVWEKYFGITTADIMNCFKDENGNYIKPNGIEFMYNETTLTESPEKRKMVEKVMLQIERIQPGFIDSFGDQMHLSDEDVMTREGINNLEGTAQMLKRFQDGKVIIDGREEKITPKKTECTEHDFHFSKHFIEKINLMKKNNVQVDLWKVKRKMQDVISKTYLKNGVEFVKTTYWNTIGKVDHNQVRTNQKIQRENIKRKQKGLKERPLVETMCAGLIPDGKTFEKIKTLNISKNQNSKKDDNRSSSYSQYQAVKGPVFKSANLTKRSNADFRNVKRKKEKENPHVEKKKKEHDFQQTKQKIQNHKQIKHQNNKAKTLTKNNNGNQSNKGFTDVFILSLIVSFVAAALFMIVYSIAK